MRFRAAPAACVLALAFAACKPGPDTYFSPTRDQREALEAVERSAEDCRRTLLERPEAEDAAAWSALAGALAALKAADGGASYDPRMEAYLAARARTLIEEAARGQKPAGRAAASARALRAYRRHIIEPFPEAARHLR